jgi:hypothetical protein
MAKSQFLKVSNIVWGFILHKEYACGSAIHRKQVYIQDIIAKK